MTMELTKVGQILDYDKVNSQNKAKSIKRARKEHDAISGGVLHTGLNSNYGVLC